jgi:hypothetical protein
MFSGHPNSTHHFNQVVAEAEGLIQRVLPPQQQLAELKKKTIPVKPVFSSTNFKQRLLIITEILLFEGQRTANTNRCHAD